MDRTFRISEAVPSGTVDFSMMILCGLLSLLKLIEIASTTLKNALMLVGQPNAFTLWPAGVLTAIMIICAESIAYETSFVNVKLLF